MKSKITRKQVEEVIFNNGFPTYALENELGLNMFEYHTKDDMKTRAIECIEEDYLTEATTILEGIVDYGDDCIFRYDFGVSDTIVPLEDPQALEDDVCEYFGIE